MAAAEPSVTPGALSNRGETQYLDLLKHILERGARKDDRTGTGTLSVFGYQMRFDLGEGFPLLTTKKLHLKSIVHELLWFLRGETNNNGLEKDGVTIWREWARPDGSLGPVYGKQWRRWEHIEFVVPRNFDPPAVQLKDGLVAGVGYGTERRNEGDFTRHLYSVWNEMLHRCYDPSRKHFAEYGGRGIFVDERWHDFNNFLADATRLPNGLLKLEYRDEYELDKDYYATNKYGPDTCLWLTRKEQTINTRRGRAVRVQSPYGDEFVTMDIAGLCQDYSLDESSVYKCVREEKDQHKGWRFKPVEFTGGLPRLRIHDQIKETIARIRHQPDSRRIIVSAWNVSEIERMALPPCHLLFQFYVAEGRLSCQMYQRSADVFLGVPFNIASYALLTMMIAQVCDLRPGEFIHTLGDAHLYLNHLEQARLQLTREPYPPPRMKINPAVRSIFEFDYGDFELTGYEAHPHIKAPVSV